MPVSEAMLSTSPSKPQLHCGTGWPSSSTPCSGICTWPSSPAMPAAPLTTLPLSTTPPPRPVPTIAATDERWSARRRRSGGGGRRGRPRWRRCCRSPAGRCRASRAPRMSKPCQETWEKFVEPFDEITPSALAGPGVSSPTARTRVSGVLVSVEDAGERLGERLDGRLRALAAPGSGSPPGDRRGTARSRPARWRCCRCRRCRDPPRPRRRGSVPHRSDPQA